MDDRTSVKTTARQAAQSAPPAEAPAMKSTEYVYKLDHDIDAHGEKIRELRFREPTGKDIVSYGNPIRLDLSMNEGHMQNQMVALAAVPPSTIAQLSAREWNTIAFELTARFFAPDLRGQAT
jgi:hypothetical protein